MIDTTGVRQRGAACRLVMGCVGLLCLAVLTSGCTTRAKDSANQEQRAMDTIKGRSWYDSEKLAYRPPKVSREFDTDVRVNGWEAEEKPTNPAPPPARGAWRNWTLGAFDSGLAIFIWVALAIGLVILAILLAGSSVKGWSRKKQLSKKAKAIVIDPARVVDLPFESKVEMDDPLETARRLASSGDYDAAVQYLYGYMLLALDRAGQIVLHRGKTNRMYMFELSGLRTLKDLLQPAMLAFEDVFFGRHSIDQARFTQLWSNLDLFHRELEPVMQGRELAAEAANA